MIYTLTINPAIDYNIEIDQFNTNEITRSENYLLTENGKGINVSKVLHHLGVETEIFGFFGGFTGQFIIDSLSPIKVNPTYISEKTRINIFLNDQKQEKKYIMLGPRIAESEAHDLLQQINLLANNSFLVVSGSFCPGINISFFEILFAKCKQKKIEIILDTSDPLLLDLLRWQPKLIKPNDDETFKFLKIKVKDDMSACLAIDKYLSLGARSILLSLGAKGIYYGDSNQILFCNAIPIKQKSSACAGDGCLAAFISKMNINLDDGLTLASSVGASIASTHGIGTLSDIDQLQKKTKIRRVR